MGHRLSCRVISRVDVPSCLRCCSPEIFSTTVMMLVAHHLPRSSPTPDIQYYKSVVESETRTERTSSPLPQLMHQCPNSELLRLAVFRGNENHGAYLGMMLNEILNNDGMSEYAVCNRKFQKEHRGMLCETFSQSRVLQWSPRLGRMEGFHQELVEEVYQQFVRPTRPQSPQH